MTSFEGKCKVKPKIDKEENADFSGTVNSLVRSMIETDENKRWVSEDYWTMTREYGHTPNGNPINGRWVLRDNNGTWIDFDKYSNDLAERNNLKLERSNGLMSGGALNDD